MKKKKKQRLQELLDKGIVKVEEGFYKLVKTKVPTRNELQNRIILVGDQETKDFINPKVGGEKIKKSI